jgi:pimeloyl-ACP methyl ester carboxylesterase
MPSRPLRLLLKIGLWTLGGALALLAIGVGYSLYSIYSFDTQTLPERHGQVDARLFAENGAPRPLIVGLGGAEGRNAWASDFWKPQRERFQQAGYALLAIGYFGLPNTPEKLDRIALDGVHAAIKRAQADPRVSAECVILLGGSKGAELALALGAHYPDIDAVIALAPGDTVFPAHTDAMTTSSWSKDGEPLAFAPMPWSATLDFIRGDILAVMQRILAGEEAEAARIEVERIQGPILLLAADADEMWPALWMSQRIIERLDAQGFAHARELVEVEGGHIEVTRHFDQVERFLREQVAKRPSCAVAADAFDA